MFSGFDMALSVGDISDNGIGAQRKNVLEENCCLSGLLEDLDYQVEENYRKLKTYIVYRLLNDMVAAGEASSLFGIATNPVDLGGMYWLMKQLRPFKLVRATNCIWYSVTLPGNMERKYYDIQTSMG